MRCRFRIVWVIRYHRVPPDKIMLRLKWKAPCRKSSAWRHCQISYPVYSDIICCIYYTVAVWKFNFRFFSKLPDIFELIKPPVCFFWFLTVSIVLNRNLHVSQTQEFTEGADIALRSFRTIWFGCETNQRFGCLTVFIIRTFQKAYKGFIFFVQY